MSYATFKLVLVSLLAGYTEIPANREPDSPDISAVHKHKGYSLKWTGMVETQLTSDLGFAYSHSVELRIGYNIQPDGTRDANALLFETLIRSIATNANFMNFTADTTFDDIDEKRQMGVAVFLFGNESC